MYTTIQNSCHYSAVYRGPMISIQHGIVVVVMLVAQSHPTLCDLMNCSLPGSSALEILQERILEWGCHSLLQGIFPTQGSNLGFPHCSGFFFFFLPQIVFKIVQSSQNFLASVIAYGSSFFQPQVGYSLAEVNSKDIKYELFACGNG